MKSTEDVYQKYCRYGLALLSDMGHCYSSANIESKQRMIGLIFPEKLVYNNNTFQTMQSNDILNLLCNDGTGFGDNGKEKSSKNAAQSCVVTSSGFKPETF